MLSAAALVSKGNAFVCHQVGRRGHAQSKIAAAPAAEGRGMEQAWLYRRLELFTFPASMIAGRAKSA